MVWTYLRSCYGFDMRVFIGGVERIFPARWFFCDPDAKLFPSPHGAEASPWLKDFEVNEAWGEIKGIKTLDRGINPGYPGVCSVGKSQWFVDGELPANFITWPTPVTPDCCGHTPPDNPDPRCPVNPCLEEPLCPNGFAPRTFRVVAVGGTGVFEGSNGDWIFTWNTFFNAWNYPLPPYVPFPPFDYGLVIAPDPLAPFSPRYHILLAVFPVAGAFWKSPALDDCNKTTYAMELESYYVLVGSGSPPSLTIEPLGDCP